MDEEVWRPAVSSRFPDLVSDLRVSNLANLENTKTKRKLSPCNRGSDGHLGIQRRGKDIFLHHLVAETFIGPRPNLMVIDHIDGKKLNNVASNLQYLTNIDNARKGRRNDTIHIGYSYWE